jgi:hypothetical protein
MMTTLILVTLVLPLDGSSLPPPSADAVGAPHGGPLRFSFSSSSSLPPLLLLSFPCRHCRPPWSFRGVRGSTYPGSPRGRAAADAGQEFTSLLK